MLGKLINIWGIGSLIIAGAIYFSAYVVDKTAYAVEILLGDPVDIVMEPGLNFKLLFVSSVIYM